MQTETPPPSRLPIRLDLTLVAFAAIGALVATVPPRERPADQDKRRYTLAISAGDDLQIRGRGTPPHAQPAGAPRVLACRNVVSLGPLDVGARCRDTTSAAFGVASGD